MVGVGYPYAECASSEGYSVSRDLVGIPCGQAKALLRVFFPRVRAYSVGRIAGAPKGFACRGAANGLSKNRLYMGSCVRLSPATMIDWGPIGGKVG